MKKVYFTTFAVVLFIIIAGCVSTQPHTTPVQTISQTTPTPTPATSSPPQQEKHPNKTLRPISVVTSVQVSSPCSGNVCNPAGPSSRITVNATSSTDVPVTHLSATVFFVPPYAPTSPAVSVGFSFHVSEGNPLMPGQTVSETSYAVIGPVQLLNANGTAAVLISGKLQNGQSFSYWTNETTS
ncbi:MAG: hypothetical protein OIN66_03420 [Candidatus Methanoperedens sp.]|nr:hypothetical protein [Candidatus Methanoperedens sp.]